MFYETLLAINKKKKDQQECNILTLAGGSAAGAGRG